MVGRYRQGQHTLVTLRSTPRSFLFLADFTPFHKIHMVGRCRQGQNTQVTLRSEGQSQGHQGQSYMLDKKTQYKKQVLYADFKFVAIYYG